MICFWNEYTKFGPTYSQSEETKPRESSAVLNIHRKFSFSILFFSASFALFTFELINRWILSKHIPLSNLYESLLFLNWSFIAIYLFFIQNEMRLGWLLHSRVQVKSEQNSGRLLGFAEFSPRELAKPGAEQKLEPLSISVTENKAKRKVDDVALFFSLFDTMYTKPLGLLGPLLSSMILFIQSFADWRLPDEMKEIQPLIPALQSNWLLMHVSIMILSYAALFVGCILSIVYLGAYWYLNWRSPSQVQFTTFGRTSHSPGLPSASHSVREANEGGEASRASRFSETDTRKSVLQQGFANFDNANFNLFFTQLDSLSYRTLAFAFPLLTLGILSGSIWANEAWGSYWSWDPKETWAFITWLIFAFYLHTRLQYNWEGQKSASVASIGFFIVWICYLGVNLLGQGLHSYGWIHN